MAENKRKNAYDLTVLLENDDFSSLLELVENFEGSDIESEVDKINFAYQIKGIGQGFMGVFRFWMPPNSVEEFKEQLRSDREILRYMLLRDNLREGKSRKSLEASTRSSKKKDESDDDSDKTGALTNEAIEEKIEEIKG